MSDPKPLTAHTFMRLRYGSRPTDYEVVGGPSEALEAIATIAISQLIPVEVVIISAKEAYDDLYLSKVGAGCYLEHSFDIIENEERLAKSQLILMGLAKKLGFGSFYHPVGIVIDEA